MKKVNNSSHKSRIHKKLRGKTSEMREFSSCDSKVCMNFGNSSNWAGSGHQKAPHVRRAGHQKSRPGPGPVRRPEPRAGPRQD